MLVRKLTLTIEEIIERFEFHKWKFFEVDGDIVTVEIPRGDVEIWRMEILAEKNTEVDLFSAGFIEQTTTREY